MAVQNKGGQTFTHENCCQWDINFWMTCHTSVELFCSDN